jgi:glycosyltransferase involved in cell wall biosynthesis
MEDGMQALALTEATDHVCGRYRVRAFAPSLAEAGCSLTIEGIERGMLGRLRQIDRAADYDVVLLQRKLLPGWQLARLRRRSRRLVFDFDDAILYRDSNDPRGPHDPRRARRFRGFVRSADAVIAGNAFLADRAETSGAPRDRIITIPTCIDPDGYSPSTNRGRAGGIELVWIGSSSTLFGLERHRAVWERIGREVVGSRFRVICDRFPDFGRLPVIPVPWEGRSEAGELARADIGVSLVPEDLWSLGKCGLKVLQYQAAGLPVVANPVGVQSTMIRDGETGYLVRTEVEWVEAIQALRDDPAGRAEMGRAARRHLEAGYSVSVWASRFVSTLLGTDRRGSTTPHARGSEDAGIGKRSPTPRADLTVGC